MTTTGIGWYILDHVISVAGTLCDNDIYECNSQPCLVEGTDPFAPGSNEGCIDLIGDYKCGCKGGFQGKNCNVSA